MDIIQYDQLLFPFLEALRIFLHVVIQYRIYVSCGVVAAPSFPRFGWKEASRYVFFERGGRGGGGGG